MKYEQCQGSSSAYLSTQGLALPDPHSRSFDLFRTHDSMNNALEATQKRNELVHSVKKPCRNNLEAFQPFEPSQLSSPPRRSDRNGP